MEALEGTEEPVGISHIESTTVVAYKVFSRFTGRVCHPELDSGQSTRLVNFQAFPIRLSMTMRSRTASPEAEMPSGIINSTFLLGSICCSS